MLQRAARERWPIPDDIRERAPKALINSMETCTDGRAVAACGRALAEFDKLNVAEVAEAVVAPQTNVQVNVVQEGPAANWRELIGRIRGLRGGNGDGKPTEQLE